MRELNLDGSETTILKALGVNGRESSGETLIERSVGLEAAEVLETVQGLIDIGYVVCDRHQLQNADDLRKARFHVNTGYSKQLREALDPRPQQPSRRRRRE